MLLNSCLLERITGDKAKFMKLASYGLQVDHEKSGIQRGMPDWSTVTPRLEYDKIFSPPRPESFNWKDYFAATGTNPCTDEVLFGHVRYLEQTVSERLFEHGKHIFVKTENDNERVARIEVCCKGKLLVNYLNIDDKERKEDVDGEITVDDVVTNTSEVEQSIKRVLAEEKEKRRKWDFLDVEQIAKYRDVLDHRLNDLIEEGQYFELQDAVEPRCVFCCRVLVNLGGIVIYEALDYTMSINITDPRCHPIGWAASHQEDSVAYCPGKYSVESIKKFAKNSVPAIVFKRYELKEHTLKVGCLVEVQDAEQRAAIFPGHVSEIINSHFVKIVSFSYGRSETRELVAHRGTHGVFPQGFCASVGYQLSLPQKSLLRDRNQSDYSWSWKSYAAEWGIPGIPTSEYSFEPIPGRESKITPMRHIEVFCYQRGVMYAALIHRAVRNLVLIELSCDTTPNPPLMFVVGCDNLFPCGFAAKYEIPFIGEAPFLSLPPLKHEGSCCRFYISSLIFKNFISGSPRFDILRYGYSAKPGNIFQERKPNDPSFLPELWMKGDVWLPRIYVHPSCRIGPWFVRSQFAALARYYEAGPIPHVFRVLLANIYQCASLEHRMDVQAILNTDDEDVAVIHVKFKWRTSPDHVLMRVPVCRTARQAAGWLRVLLRSLGCCPHLFSFEKAPKCTCTKITPEERRRMGELQQEMAKKTNSLNAEKRRRRAPKVGSSKRRRTQEHSPPPKEPDHHPPRTVLTSDDDFSRSSVDEMPRLHPADPVGYVPNGSTLGEETSNQCSSSDEMPTNLNGIPQNDSSPLRPLRIDGDIMEWDANQLIGFLRTTFPDISDVTNVLEKEHIDGAHLIMMSQQDCIDSLGLNLGPALRLYEVIQEIKSANESHL
ncbi:hypothetical protein Y032_0200g1703 [Ancylostoma ceylanicum]|uniref:SLED domain-containing protein n=1 Tax=Ancylostoma ceylanicum TaxID=53326 RepID=A0A016SNQ2_9BILA|nr:hypothetical protein Y032_0200g1703 [Ancylostoma ceylanicum]